MSAGVQAKMKGVEKLLEQLVGELEVLSPAIWQDIDHDDPGRLEEGVRFKQSYNEQRRALEEAMDRMLVLLRAYPAAGPGMGAAEPQAEPAQSEAGEIPDAGAEPDAGPSAQISVIAAGLDQKVPFGFVLGGQTFSSASAWPLFYEALLQEFYGRAPEKLSRLADSPDMLQHGDRPLFARVPDLLEDPLPIANTIFAEADMPPEDLLEAIKRLVAYMGYPLETFKILLKEKNRGTVETLSLAA